MKENPAFGAVPRRASMLQEMADFRQILAFRRIMAPYDVSRCAMVAQKKCSILCIIKKRRPRWKQERRLT
jgi:hypothetical protein